MTARDVLDAVADELGIPCYQRSADRRWYLDRVIEGVRSLSRHDLADCIEAVDKAGKR